MAPSGLVSASLVEMLSAKLKANWKDHETMADVSVLLFEALSALVLSLHYAVIATCSSDLQHLTFCYYTCSIYRASYSFSKLVLGMSVLPG